MTYCVSDLHGEYDLFCRLMQKIRFSASDRLIVCGDVLDKGKDCIRLLQLLFSLPNATCLIGNHEYDFLKFYWALMGQSPDDFDGVLQRLRGYFTQGGEGLDWDTMDRLENLPFYVETEGFICVHAGVPLDAYGRILPLSQAQPEHLVYDRRFKDNDVVPQAGKCVIFGHTPTSYTISQPRIIKTLRVGARQGSDRIEDYVKTQIDTGAWLNGVLGCLCVETCETAYVWKDEFQR